MPEICTSMLTLVLLWAITNPIAPSGRVHTLSKLQGAELACVNLRGVSTQAPVCRKINLDKVLSSQTPCSIDHNATVQSLLRDISEILPLRMEADRYMMLYLRCYQMSFSLAVTSAVLWFAGNGGWLEAPMD